MELRLHRSRVAAWFSSNGTNLIPNHHGAQRVANRSSTWGEELTIFCPVITGFRLTRLIASKQCIPVTTGSRRTLRHATRPCIVCIHQRHAPEHMLHVQEANRPCDIVQGKPHSQPVYNVECDPPFCGARGVFFGGDVIAYSMHPAIIAGSRLLGGGWRNYMDGFHGVVLINVCVATHYGGFARRTLFNLAI